MAAAALCRPGNMDPTGVVTGAVTSFGSSLLIIIGVNGLRKKRSVFLPPGVILLIISISIIIYSILEPS